jgi:hypothetical protein
MELERAMKPSGAWEPRKPRGEKLLEAPRLRRRPRVREYGVRSPRV